MLRMSRVTWYSCVVSDQPLSLYPSFRQRGLDDALRERLSTSRFEVTTLVVVQDRWYCAITATRLLPGKPDTSQGGSIRRNEGLAS